MSDKRTIDCPQCGGPARIDDENSYRPFCCRRCKLIDLGDWLDESNRIPDPTGFAGNASWQHDDSDGGPPH